VLGLVVGEHLFRLLPDVPEGDLARIRAAVVSEEALAPVAAALGVGAALRLGRGEVVSGGRDKPSILADALEAVIGAVYLDAGWAPAQDIVLSLLGERIGRAADEPDDFDHKSRLQEMAVRQGAGVPRYLVVGSGPDHDRTYDARVFVGGECRGVGTGSSKKDAEQEAARRAWLELNRA